MKEVMTMKEVMEILNIGRNTLQKLLVNKEIKAKKVGHQWRITRQALRDYLEYEQ